MAPYYLFQRNPSASGGIRPDQDLAEFNPDFLEGLWCLTWRPETEHVLDIFVYGPRNHGKTQFIVTLARLFPRVEAAGLSEPETQMQKTINRILDRPHEPRPAATASLSHYVFRWRPRADRQLRFSYWRSRLRNHLLGVIAFSPIVFATLWFFEALWLPLFVTLLLCFVGSLVFEAWKAPSNVEVVVWDIPGEEVWTGTKLAHSIRSLCAQRQAVHGENYRVLPVLICNPIEFVRDLSEPEQRALNSIENTRLGNVIKAAERHMQSIGRTESPLVVVNYANIRTGLDQLDVGDETPCNLQISSPAPHVEAVADSVAPGPMSDEIEVILPGLLRRFNDLVAYAANSKRVVSYDALSMRLPPESKPGRDKLHVAFEYGDVEKSIGDHDQDIKAWLCESVRARRLTDIAAPELYDRAGGFTGAPMSHGVRDEEGVKVENKGQTPTPRVDFELPER